MEIKKFDTSINGKKGTVLVDVFTWALNAQNYGRVPMEGIYRHTEALARRYIPAILLGRGESVPQKGLDMLKPFIGNVRIYTNDVPSFRELEAEAGIWLSPALDGCSPVLNSHNFPKSIVRAAVVHDFLALRGEFGASNMQQMVFGLNNTDLFLPVSQTVSTELTVRLPQVSGKIVKYGGFHPFDTLPEPKRARNIAVGISTIYPRKRVNRNLVVAQAFGCVSYFHIGRYVALDRDELHEERFVSECLIDPAFHFAGTLKDSSMWGLLSLASLYVCMSEAEGFSLTPLEAILLGVPRIALSEISVHREVYKNLNGVRFISEGEYADILYNGASSPVVKELSRVSDTQRRELFDNYRFTSVIAPFENWVNDHASK